MLLPQRASAFNPVSFSEAAEAKDKCFHGQEEAYNWDKRDLRKLAPDEKSRVQCEKTGFWDKVGTVIEIRPDNLSYLLDVEGKLLIRARFTIRSLEEGGVSDADLIHNQGGAQSDFVPRRSERIKEKTSVQKCALPTTKSTSCGSFAASTGSTGSKWPKTRGTSPSPTKFSRMPGDFPWLTYNGRVSPQGPRQSLSAPSLPLQLSSAVGSGLRPSANPSPSTRSSCLPLPPPLCRDLPLPVPVGRSGQILQRFQLSKQQNGSGLPPVGPASQGHTCHSLSSRPSSRTMEWDPKDIPATRFPRSTSEVKRPFNTLVTQRLPIARGLLSSLTSQSQLSRSSAKELHGVPRHQSPPLSRSPLPLPGPLPALVSPSPSQAQSQKERPTRLSCGPSAKPRPRRGQQGSIQTNNCSTEEKVNPAHIGKDYNNAVVNCAPGSVQGMKVFF